MKKLTSFIDESNKQEFTKKLLLNLDNNTVLEAKITIKDLNESFANAQILENLLNKTIKSVTVINETEDILPKIESPINNNETVELYVPMSSIFDTEVRYDIDKISSALIGDEDVTSTHTEHDYGWDNQPQVVVVKVETDNLQRTKERLTKKLEHALGTQWVRLSKKDW